MKNIQVIDSADNCTYSIYAVTDEEFCVLFPGKNQDIEFVEDLITRIGDDGVEALLTPVWKRLINKTSAAGIHGTLFYGLEFKRKYYPTKCEAEMVVVV